ncbi:putative toxin-antitoxin system toxin component, PIN family [Candidatus Viridilinea mediisalina]|uniref:Putative toxin-antitoxin system toxin component, PIN family n=1 Tax=Candidatus Viridilinea mediisalina TaxID=2024553 RepID=A0A2A6RDW1_9CHLR|nr:putative toxin-antitoxin system toxin component, PIN family [Candidatus Viridilinea mediisalina]PDW00924.1 putative toxin-antitoxin system toxin component, PIN family [Candidatus Viridilinea mediisalina]
MLPIVVFDTNVLLSAIGWRGRPALCLDRVRHGLAIGFTSEDLLQELRDKLRTKLVFSDSQVEQTLTYILSFIRITKIKENIMFIAADPDDDRVLECAVAAGANYLVTGDRRHLLPLRSFRTIEIITVAEFLTLVPDTQ